jgi:hypothetical protein
VLFFIFCPEVTSTDSTTTASKQSGGGIEMSRLDARTLKEEVASMDRRPLVDLGHPLLNRVTDSFIRAAGVGAARAVSKEAYFVTVEGLGGDNTGLDNVKRNTHFSSARGKKNAVMMFIVQAIHACLC